MLHRIPPFLIIVSQGMNDGLIMYMTMLKIFHPYLISMGTTTDNMKFIISPFIDMILMMVTYRLITSHTSLKLLSLYHPN